MADGAEAGAELVKEASPGPEGSFPSGLTKFDGKLRFSADNGVSGAELWALHEA